MRWPSGQASLQNFDILNVAGGAIVVLRWLTHYETSLSSNGMLGHESVALEVVAPLSTFARLALERLESICLSHGELYAD